MTVAVSVKIKGIQDLVRAMRDLPLGLAVTVEGDGLFAAAQVAAKEMKATSAFTDRTGLLRSRIRARRRSVRVFLPDGSILRVPGGGAEAGAYAPHAHLVESGTKQGAAPHPFILPALIYTQTEQVAAAIPAMRKGLLRLAVRLSAGQRNVSSTLRRLART